MRKKIIISLGVILACSVISAIIEIFAFNFQPIFNHPESSSSLNFAATTENQKTKYTFDLHDTYIRKLIIDYQATKDVNYTISYNTPTSFDQTENIIIEDIFDDAFTKSVTNINRNISDLSIEIEDNHDSVKIGNISIDNQFHFNFSRFIFIFLSCLLICAIIYFFKDGFKTSKLYLYFAVIGTLLGSMIIIAQPASTYYSWDDQIHFESMLDFPWPESQYLVGEYSASDVPNSAGQDSINSIEEQQAQNTFFNTIFDSSNRPPSTFSYNKIIYAPMSFGYHLAKLFDLNFSICFRIGKLFGLLTYILFLAYAIKTIKIGKKLLAVISLLPTSIFLASEYSYDPIVFGGLMVFFAHLINLFLDRTEKFNFKTALIMILSLTVACLAKAIYIPFILLILLIPKNRFSSPKVSHLVKTGIILIGLSIIFTFILPLLTGTKTGDLRNIGTSATGQISSILSHPLDYAKILLDSIIGEFGDRFFNNISFSYISILPNANSDIFLYIFFFLIIFFFLTDNAHNKLSAKLRISIFLITTITVILIYTALYVDFTTVGSNTIAGVQNRYFLPLLFPLLLCLQPTKIKSTITPKITNSIVIIAPTIILFIYIYFSILVPYTF